MPSPSEVITPSPSVSSCETVASSPSLSSAPSSSVLDTTSGSLSREHSALEGAGLGFDKGAGGKDRRMPPGRVPTFIGVDGGRVLSKHSGERTGPKDTLFRALFRRNHSVTEDSRFRFRGEGMAVASSSSGMDIREVLRNDRREVLCSTCFSAEPEALRENGKLK